MKTNSKKYEGIYIFNPDTILADYEKAINSMKQIAKRVYTFDIKGIKNLAYEIKGCKQGFLYTLNTV